jgi:DNA polymerase-3 subunit epsilon
MNIPYVLKKFEGERIVAIDTENTGGTKEKNKIIQLGVVEFKDGKKIVEHSKLFGGGKSLPICIGIHGILDSQREGLPHFETVCPNVAKYLSNCIIVGHNVIACDIRMISEYLDKIGLKIENHRVIDTYRLAKKVLPIKKFNLELCCAEFNIPFGQHDALGDAKSSLLVLEEIVKKREQMDKEWFFEELK